MPTTYAIPNGRTVFDATTYTGNGASPRTIANQYGFQPDFVWVKNRTAAGNYHRLQNSVIGANKMLFSNSTDSEQTNEINGYLSAFTSSGFTLTAGTNSSSGTNSNGDNFVAWQWQAGQGTTSTNTQGSITSTVSANTTAGFSIVTYTGNGTGGATVGHGLGVIPAMVIVKNRNSTQFWIVQHQSLTSITYNLYLQATDSQQNDSQFTGKSSTVMTLSGSSSVNTNGNTYVMYCFAEVAGYSRFGSYTGNGSSDGPFVYLGFRPRYILTKKTNASGTQWNIWDSVRNTYNVAGSNLWADSSEAEATSDASYGVDILSNGFKLRNSSSGRNANGDTYIYAAFAENPFKYATAR